MVRFRRFVEFIISSLHDKVIAMYIIQRVVFRNRQSYISLMNQSCKFTKQVQTIIHAVFQSKSQILMSIDNGIVVQLMIHSTFNFYLDT
jgi:hypothetical protein